MSKSWVAYVGPFQFPWGQPGSRRVYGIAAALGLAGHRVIVGSGDAAPLTPQPVEGAPGVLHCGLGELPARHRSVVARAFQLFVTQGRRTIHWLEAQESRPTHVIVYGGHAPFMARMAPWCRKHGVALLADVVEWYDGSHMTGGYWGPFHASAKWALRFQYPKCDGIIAISSYLERYYRAAGCRVVRVPPTLDVPSADAILDRDSAEEAVRRLALIYAGSPGKKDLLAEVIRGIGSVDPDGRLVRLDVLGPTAAEVAHLFGGGGRLPPFVNAVGRVPQQEVSAAYRNADFSVLLREPLQFAHAGFPTKVPESLSAGTPVICNATSDIGDFVRDGIEGLICTDHRAEAFSEALKRALAMAPDKRMEMRRAARTQAKRSFDIPAYSARLAGFLGEVGK